MKSIFGSHINLTAKVMDLRLERQNLVTGNIANVNTPNYRPRRIEFEGELQDALALSQRGKMTRTDGQHMPSAFSADGFEGDVSKEFRAHYTYGEDSVDLDKEVTNMSKNTLMYNALATIIKKNFTGMQKVIMDGGK